MPDFYHRTSCSLCNSMALAQRLSLPACPPVDAFRYKSHSQQKSPYFPMDLYQCEDCGYLQLLDIVSPKLLFGDYIYLSSSSPDLNEHFENYSNFMQEYFDHYHQFITWMGVRRKLHGLFGLNQHYVQRRCSIRV